MSEHRTGSAPKDIREILAARTVELCAIPSETGSEERIADHVEALCAAAVGEKFVTRIGHSIVCDPSPGAGSPVIALVGHLDTVRCADDQPLGIREDRVYGCGSSDMKGGVATMIELLNRWKSLTSARPVWIFYDAEEARARSEEWRPPRDRSRHRPRAHRSLPAHGLHGDDARDADGAWQARPQRSAMAR